MDMNAHSAFGFSQVWLLLGCFILFLRRKSGCRARDKSCFFLGKTTMISSISPTVVFHRLGNG